MSEPGWAIGENQRRTLASEALAGYVHGPAAAVEPTRRALERMRDATAVVLVEGVSDQIAVETLARRKGRDLDSEGVVVLPIGGAHGVAGYLRRFGPTGADLNIAGLCDAAEVPVFSRALRLTGLGPVGDREELAGAGFYVCDEDLEDELIRAAGAPRVLQVFAAQGDLGSFRTMQRQPAWRGRAIEAQMRRFLGAGARRKLRYARLLTEALADGEVPLPLESVLAAV